MRRRRYAALAGLCIPFCVLPLVGALIIGWRVPSQRILPELPASALADYTSRFGTGFASLREAYIRQVLGRRGSALSAADPLGLGSSRAGRSGVLRAEDDRLSSLGIGSGLRISPGSPDQPTGVEFWRSKDPSISTDGSVVAYVSTDTRIPGMDPTQSCYASPPGPTAHSAIWWSHRGRFQFAPQPDPGPCEQVVVQNVRTGDTTIASMGPSGELANAPVQKIMVSGNGRYVTFLTAASNLVPDDTNDLEDVFVRDLVAGRTELATVSMHGGPIRRPHQNYPEQLGYPYDAAVPDVLGSVGAQSPNISHDGRYVVFESSADDLVPGDTPQSVDVFVRDRLRETTERVSLSSTGVAATREDVRRDNNERLQKTSIESAHTCISPNARYVAFRSWGSNLVPGDRNGRPDIFLRDRLTGRTELVTVSSSGVQQDGDAFPGVGEPWHFPWVFAMKACVSNDGRYVVFGSDSTNLVDHDTNGSTDIFVRDRVDSTTRRVSLNADGTEAEMTSDGFFCLDPTGPRCENNPPPTGDSPVLSPDGRFIAFHSVANLTEDDPDRDSDDVPGTTRESRRGDMDLFVYEIATRRLTRLDVRDLAWVRVVDHDVAEVGGTVMAPAVSGDASLVAFQTYSQSEPMTLTGGIHLYRWK